MDSDIVGIALRECLFSEIPEEIRDHVRPSLLMAYGRGIIHSLEKVMANPLAIADLAGEARELFAESLKDATQ